MSVRRVMGTETEYGITRPGDPRANPAILSGLVVRGYAAAAGPRRALPTGSGWDYADETPLRDARGFEMARALAHVSQLTDEDDPAMANSSGPAARSAPSGTSSVGTGCRKTDRCTSATLRAQIE